MSETTFKLIYHSTAVQLYEARHPIYIIWDGENTIKPCYVHPDKVLVTNPTFYITTELHNKLMNKRTPQQAFIDSKPAQEAWLAGKPLQYGYPKTSDDWQDLHNSCEPRFADPTYIWRPKPEPEKVPFNQQTLPADAWFKHKTGDMHGRILDVGKESVALFSSRFTYLQLADQIIWSTDRINWFPCYTLKTT